ncbi:MAG: hypothetical protein JXJ04_13205 [Spirochaetales bacterium]|nr:hypothetical protein [Spirochaetales bacterium]
MRTTVTLDEDVFAKIKSLAQELHKPFNQVLNESLRLGLKEMELPGKSREYKTESQPMGLLDGLDQDNIGELLARTEGEDSI